MNQQAYLKKKTKQLNRNALSQSPKATPISSSPRPSKFIVTYKTFSDHYLKYIYSN